MLQIDQSQGLSETILSRSPIRTGEVARTEASTGAASGSRQKRERVEGQERDSSRTGASDSVEISEEAQEIAKLAARDREVRAHEAAHAASGGRYAGAPALTYTKGPDGRSYATGGEVPIDVSPVSGDPQATLQKAQVVRNAALAPAQPSAQDMRVASRASAMAAKARSELAKSSGSEGSPVNELNPEENRQQAPVADTDGTQQSAPNDFSPVSPSRRGIRLYA